MSTKTLDSEPEFTLDAGPSGAPGEPRPRVTAPERANRRIIVLLAVLALVAAAAALYFLWTRGDALPEPVVPTPPASVPAPLAPLEPAIRHPVEEIPVVAATESGGVQFPLPSLDDSDTVAKDALATIFNGDAILRLLVPDGIIRRIVATVDNLPRKTIAARILPVNPVPGPLATASAADGTSIAGANAARYAPYVGAAEAMDTERLAGLYVRLYPLFQQAYVELGYPGGYFNDRLIGVIDHLLAAPEPRPPVYLSQPRIMFEFADPELQALSAGQKILVRIGLDNELRVKAKLREIRRALTGKTAKG